MEYILCFITSLIFTYLAEKSDRGMKKCYIFIALICPVLLAGLRDVSIGIDVNMYVTPTFYIAQNSSSLVSFLHYYETEEDLGFFIYVFFVTKCFNSLWVLMALNHLIIMVPIFAALFYVKRKYDISVWFGLAIWLLSFYNMSLCVIRQEMSISLAIMALLALSQRKYKVMAFWAFLSVTFHKTSIVFLLIAAAFYIISLKVHKNKIKNLIVLAILGAVFIGMQMISFFLAFMNTKYSDRLEEYGANSGGTLTMIFYFFIAILPFVITYYNKKISNDQFFMYMPLIGFVIYVLSRDFMYLSRMIIPFNEMSIFTLPCVLRNKYMKWGILLLYLINWIVAYCIRGDWETYPYILSKDILF